MERTEGIRRELPQLHRRQNTAFLAFLPLLCLPLLNLVPSAFLAELTAGLQKTAPLLLEEKKRREGERRADGQQRDGDAGPEAADEGLSQPAKRAAAGAS